MWFNDGKGEIENYDFGTGFGNEMVMVDET